MCRLAAAHDAEQKRKQDERSKVGPQFVKGPSEQMKLPPYAKSTSGEGFALGRSKYRCCLSLASGNAKGRSHIQSSRAGQAPLPF